MVRARLVQLAERRARLIDRARVDREALAGLVARTDGASDLAAHAFAAGRRLLEEMRRQPLIAAVLAAVLVVLRPRRALGWAIKGWSAWRVIRGALRWWQHGSAHR